MNRFGFFAIVALSLACLYAGPSARAEDAKMELDCAANVNLLDAHFGRYGYLPTRSIIRDDQGVRFMLPSSGKDVGQTGLYSHFKITGDFEFSATFELLYLPAPAKGYGVSGGIAIEILDLQDRPIDTLSLARGQRPRTDKEFFVTRGKPMDGEFHYENTYYPARAKKGRLVLRRQKKELLCLVADGPGELQELHRLPFSDARTKVRLFADPGGTPNAMDVRLGQIRLHAEEITGGIPQREQGGGLGWWLILSAVLILGIIGYVLYRRKRLRDAY